MTHVVLFDQDSIPSQNMVDYLFSAMQQLNDLGIKVAAVGPHYKDGRIPKHQPFIRITGFKYDRNPCLRGNKIVESDILISSGCLIPLSVFSKVGGLLNSLFVDQIDMEWCFRSRSNGYKLFGVCDADLQHSLGMEPLSIFGRKIVHQSPNRHYYIFRNAVWLLFRGYTPVSWKLLFIRMILARLIAYVIFVPPRAAYLRMFIRGIWHGLIGRLGKLEIT